MDRLAVLMCVAEGTDRALVRKAVRSTAASGAEGDLFLILIDGGAASAWEFLGEECGRLSVRLLEERQRRGLASGLNRLISEALSEETVGYMARMDADDESCEGRLAVQREHLNKNKLVDVAGSFCWEVNEDGVVIQEKQMPITHEVILRTLPQRNPMNHPTVMLRRSVFENGLRYREDVGLVEDYYLWIECAAAGFRFENLGQPLLKFRRDRRFFNRRGGWRQAIGEFRVRYYAMRTLRAWSLGNVGWAVGAFGLRLMPGWLQQELYRRMR